MKIMHKDFNRFYSTAIKNFFEGVVNLFVFLPYFFSVTTLINTLFAPWKGVVLKKTIKGFTFSDFFNRLGYDLVSRGMGFVMRFSILMFYVILQVFYFISLLIIIPLFIILIPFLYIWFLFEDSEETKKNRYTQKFLKTHVLKSENTVYVTAWAQQLYTEKKRAEEWWKLHNLFSIPPLARDWAMGYTPTLDDYSEDLTNPTYQSHIKHIVGRKNEVAFIERTLSKHEEANIVIVGEEGVGKHAVIDSFAQKVYLGKINQLLAYKRVLKLNMEKILTQFTDQKQREDFFSTLLEEAANAKNIILCIEQLDRYIISGEGRVDLSIPFQKFGKVSSVQFVGFTLPFFYQKYIVPNEKIVRLFTKLDVFEVSKGEAVKVLLDAVPSFEKRYNVIIPYEAVINTIEKSDFFITELPFPEKAVQLLDSACVAANQVYHSQIVTTEIINTILTEKTHIPVSLTAQLKNKLLHLETYLKQRIVNQNSAVIEVSTSLRRAFLLIGKRKKPLASFLFLGPTGVGKTETAKAIAYTFFGSEKNIIRLDMSNYQSKTDIEKLIGSMETTNPGLLTQAIRTKPYAVLLLDELEKANKDLLNIFLSVLDEGYFTDGYGKRVDCKNLIIVATSNAGADIIYKSNPSATSNQNELIQYLTQNHIFSPEFLNRFDGVVTFNQLDQSAAITIARTMLKTVADQIYSLYKVKIQVSDETLKNIVQNNYDPTFGARNMERALRQQLEDKVAKIILSDNAKEGDTIYL
jgi:ATP-dependent Clp protease ATP-binding subunit ClpC